MSCDVLNDDEFVLANLILERKSLFYQILQDAGVTLAKKRLKQPFIFTKGTKLKSCEKTQDFLVISLSQIERILVFCEKNQSERDKFATNYKKAKITRLQFIESIYQKALDILKNHKSKFDKDFSIFLKKT